MKSQRNFPRQAEPRRIGHAVIIAVMLISLCFLTVMKARYCSSSYGKVSERQILLDGEDSGSEAVTAEEEEQEQEEELRAGAGAAGDGRSRLVCDDTSRRSVTCDARGDVRVVGSSQTIFSDDLLQDYKIKPYARKHDPVALSAVKEWTLKPLSSADGAPPPRCTKRHSVPALVFSNGGFSGNLFHDYTDVLFPVFISSAQFHGRVQFLLSGLKSWWVEKFDAIFRQLSNYDIIDIDNDKEVRCFRRIIVGATFHKEMGIDPSRTPNGYSVADFKQMLRNAFGLERKVATSPSSSGKKPRLLIISRKNSRKFLNVKAMADTAAVTGFRVSTFEPDIHTNMTAFAQLVNSADVMIGVHGAGLTNMVFLPEGAVLIQVVPFGGLEWLTRVTFKEPASDMGIHYIDYNVDLEESSLMEQYPRDHPVLTDPYSVHKQGWDAIKSTYLNTQNVRLNLGKFRSTLQEAINLLPR